MKRAIWPAGLVLLALVLSAAAPTPEVRAAPPRAVPLGDAARPGYPLPSAFHGRPLGDGSEDPASRSTGRTTSSSGPTSARATRRCTALASVPAGPCSIRTDSRSPRPEGRGRQSPSTAPTTSSSGVTRARSSGRASIRAGSCSIPAGFRSRRGRGGRAIPDARIRRDELPRRLAQHDRDTSPRPSTARACLHPGPCSTPRGSRSR